MTRPTRLPGVVGVEEVRGYQRWYAALLEVGVGEAEEEEELGLTRVRVNPR